MHNNFISDFNNYRNGKLPEAHQRIHAPTLEILRCSFWLLRTWRHANLAAPYWRLYWNPEPGGNVCLNAKSYPLTPDNALLITPNTLYATDFNSTPGQATIQENNLMIGRPLDSVKNWRQEIEHGAIRHLFIHFRVGQPYDSIAPQILTITIERNLRKLINEILRGIDSRHDEFSYRASISQYALIHQALAELPEKAWPARPNDPRILRVLNHIEKNFHKPLHNENFGKIAGMSPNALARLFQQYMGQTPMQYTQHRRIELASVLLHHSEKSIEQIAADCGFGNRNYFSRVFQRHYNLGPATFRKLRMA